MFPAAKCNLGFVREKVMQKKAFESKCCGDNVFYVRKKICAMLTCAILKLCY